MSYSGEILFLVADNCPESKSVVPPLKSNKSKTTSRIEYEVLIENPYALTDLEFFKEVHHVRRNRPVLKIESYDIKQSNLVKKYGWGIHRNMNGKLALIPMESADYNWLKGSIKTAKAYSINKIDQSKTDYTDLPLQIDTANFIRFVKSKEGEILQTRKNKKFTVTVTDLGLNYMPTSNKVRKHNFHKLEQVLELFNKTNSLLTTEYTGITQNSSYTLTLIELYLNEIGNDNEGSKGAGMSSFSWTIVNNDLAHKVLDKSAFLHKGTAIPASIRYFFLDNALKPGQKKPLSLIYDGREFSAHIEMDHQDSPRTRLYWQSEISTILQKLYPSHYQHYQLGEEANSSRPHMLFERLNGFSSYTVDFIGDVKRELIFHDIEAEELEDRGPQIEGGVKEYYGKRYERSPINRKKAIKIHGTVCNVCGFNFEAVYGVRGVDYIDVHHIKPISTFTEEQHVDPFTDLITLCSNCHRMIHRRSNDILSIEQLKNIVQEIKSMSEESIV